VEGEGRPAEVRELVAARVDALKVGLAAAVAGVVKATPGATIDESRAAVAAAIAALEGDAGADGNKVTGAVSSLTSTVSEGVSRGQEFLSEELQELQERPAEVRHLLSLLFSPRTSPHSLSTPSPGRKRGTAPFLNGSAASV
jgi:hypothetical protein